MAIVQYNILFNCGKLFLSLSAEMKNVYSRTFISTRLGIMKNVLRELVIK